MNERLNRLKQFVTSGQLYQACWQKLTGQTKVTNFDNKDLILFVVPNLDLRSGGILSIFNILDVTRGLLPKKVAECVTFGSFHYLYRPLWFKNKFCVKWLDDVVNSNYKAKSILIHCPEGHLQYLLEYIKSKDYSDYFKNATLNILNQNAEQMPDDIIGFEAARIFKNVTMTLAFKCNEDLCYGYLNQKPIYISANFYGDSNNKIEYRDKKSLCIISPDNHERKKEIVDELKRNNIKCYEFKSIPFHKFKRLQEKAKWTISFGEGYDGYTIPQFTRGGIGLAVFNNTFFPKGFEEKGLPPFIFSSYDDMLNNIVKVMKELDNEESFVRWGEYMASYSTKLNAVECVDNGLRTYYNLIYQLDL